jgi:hypothetical protein
MLDGDTAFTKEQVEDALRITLSIVPISDTPGQTPNRRQCGVAVLRAPQKSAVNEVFAGPQPRRAGLQQTEGE